MKGLTRSCREIGDIYVQFLLYTTITIIKLLSHAYILSIGAILQLWLYYTDGQHTTKFKSANKHRRFNGPIQSTTR